MPRHALSDRHILDFALPLLTRLLFLFWVMFPILSPTAKTPYGL